MSIFVPYHRTIAWVRDLACDEWYVYVGIVGGVRGKGKGGDERSTKFVSI